MLLASEAYVLVRYPLTESSWLVSFFTRDEGKVRAVAKGARRTRSPFRGALEPMSRVRVEISQREGRELGALNSADLLEGAMDLYGRWPHASVLLGMSEVLERALAEHNREEETYRLVGATVEGLRTGMAPEGAWTYFLAWFLRLHGVLPKPDACVSCGGEPRPLHFDAGAGGWLCRRCRAARPEQGAVVSDRAASLLASFFGGSPRDLAGSDISLEALKNLENMVYLALVAYLGRPLATLPDFSAGRGWSPDRRDGGVGE
jgi:DNA repair protein RecO (recombination protein O)